MCPVSTRAISTLKDRAKKARQVFHPGHACQARVPKRDDRRLLLRDNVRARSRRLSTPYTCRSWVRRSPTCDRRLAERVVQVVGRRCSSSALPNISIRCPLPRKLPEALSIDGKVRHACGSPTPEVADLNNPKSAAHGETSLSVQITAPAYLRTASWMFENTCVNDTSQPAGTEVRRQSILVLSTNVPPA